MLLPSEADAVTVQRRDERVVLTVSNAARTFRPSGLCSLLTHHCHYRQNDTRRRNISSRRPCLMFRESCNLMPVTCPALSLQSGLWPKCVFSFSTRPLTLDGNTAEHQKLLNVSDCISHTFNLTFILCAVSLFLFLSAFMFFFSSEYFPYLCAVCCFSCSSVLSLGSLVWTGANPALMWPSTWIQTRCLTKPSGYDVTLQG